ncbi:hypothetical protein V6N11_054246 [Hibiscus sabdariffa]|uniref:Uncharacterized protein n=1 Tax=Hibiscus sabdariffa TaxID=183260 RepID=A0ABR2S3H5_9ROSI
MYRNVSLKNSSNEDLIYYDHKDWYGSANFAPQLIPKQLSMQIKHRADSRIRGSKGDVAYTIRNNIKWIATWSNMKDKNNKDFYQSLLDTSSPDPDTVYKFRFTAAAHVEPSSVTPLVEATLSSAIRKL